MKIWYRLGLLLLVLFPLQLVRAQTISRVNAYTYSSFTGTFVDISATGTKFTYSGGVDTGSATFALPFVFPYDGTSLAAGSNVVVSTNGAISLASAKSLNGPSIGNPARPGLLGIFNGDMVAGSGGSNYDYYQVTGTAPNRVLIIEYHAIHFPGVGAGTGGGGSGAGAPLSKMEVKLYETTGVIEFIYGDHNYYFGPTTLTSTIGLNGYTTPSFRYIVYASNVQTSPATDIRWTPATAGTSPQVAFDATQLFRFAKKMLRDTLTQYVHVTASGAPIVVNGVSIIGLDSPSYTVAHIPSNPIPVGFTDSIGIKFSPRIEGGNPATLVVATTGDNIPSDSIALNGIGTLPRIAVSLPGGGTSINFDSVALGDQNCLPITIQNVGSDTLRITNQLLDGDYDFTLNALAPSDATIVPGSSKIVTVCFKPLRNGDRFTTLRLYSNIPRTFDIPSQDTGRAFIDITGIGVALGKLSLFGAVADTAIVGSPSHCIIDTLKNTGSAEMTVTGWTLSGPNASEFTVSAPSTPFTVASGQSIPLQFCFAPAVKEMVVDTITINATSSGHPSTFVVPLIGVGLVECASANPTAVVFGTDSLTLVTTTAVDTITVTNCGDLPTNYLASDLMNSAFTLLAPKTVGPVAPQGTATFNVAFRPSTLGKQTDTLRILAQGQSPSIVLPVAGIGAGVIAGATYNAISAPKGDCKDFDVTLSNTGNYPWILGTPSLTGASNNGFTVVSGPTPDTIAPGGSAKMTIRFCPDAVGQKSATLSFPQEKPVPMNAASFQINGTGEVNAGVAMEAQNGFVLGQSYPNPASGAANIQFTLPKASFVKIELMDARGVAVRSIYSAISSIGDHSIAIDTKELANGTYFYTLTSGDIRLTRSMIVNR